MPDSFDLPEPAGLEAAFGKHMARALALSTERLSRSRGDAVRARHNLLIGLNNLRPHRYTLEQRWHPDRVAALFADEDVADAAVFAQRRAEGIAAMEKVLRHEIARSYVTRDLLLSALEVAAKFGLVPEARVGALRSGTGALDTAFDNVGAVAVFREFQDVLAGKTPVTPALLEEALTLGNSLQARITPKNQAPVPGEPTVDPRDEAFDLALRLWTLVADKHSEARMAGREVFGNRFGTLVPPLQANTAPAKKKVEAATPAA